jgi:nitroreductase
MSTTSTPASAALHQLLQRRSCRAFLPDDLPRATIERLLTLAQRTPSWCNTQPWQVTVTRGEGTQRLKEAMVAAGDEEPDLPFPTSYDGPYRERRREAAKRLYEAVGVTWGDREASARQTALNFELFGAPHLAVVTTDAGLGNYGAIDCGLYVQTFLLAAESLGLGTIPQAAIALRSATVRRILGLNPDRLVVCRISFGYPDTAHPATEVRTDRAELADVVTYPDCPAVPTAPTSEEQHDSGHSERRGTRDRRARARLRQPGGEAARPGAGARQHLPREDDRADEGARHLWLGHR